MVLQASEHSEMVRHAVIGIGALDRTMDTLPCKKFLATRGLTEGSRHHQFALKEYGKAIRQMSEALARGRKDIRTALIVCLLTIVFESFNGEIPTAMLQVRNGLNLIKEWKERLADSVAFELKPRTPDRELVHAFERLDNNYSMIGDAKPVDFHDPRIENIHASRGMIPKRFSSPVEASMYIESIINCMFHWIAAAYAWGSQDKDEAKHRSEPDQASAAEVARVKLRMRTFEQQRQAYLEGFQYWFRSFEPLLEASRDPRHHDHIACTALHLRYKAVFTSLKADHFKDEMCYDRYTDDFRDIVEMAERLIQINEGVEVHGRAKFTFDGPILTSVYIVTLKCRDPDIRRRAIKLLKGRPRREGIFDSTLTTNVALLQMRIEEAGRVGNFIPEHARIRGIKATYNIMEKTGQMKYLKMISETNSKFAKHHLEFHWDNIYSTE